MITTKEFKENIGVINANLSIEKIGKESIIIFRKYFEQILGEEFLNEIIDYYENDGSSLAEINNLIKEIQYPLSHLIIFENFHILSLKIGDSGIYVEETENKRSLFPNERFSGESSFREKGFSGIENLLSFLERNITIYPKWQSSEFFKKNKTHFIRSAKELTKFQAFINNSRF
jgi:hypothetical protein